MKNKLNGEERLNNLTKKQFIKLLERSTNPKIAQDFGLNLATTNRVVGAKTSFFNIKSPRKAYITKEIAYPFSYNEDDYGGGKGLPVMKMSGSYKPKGVMITKYGILRFNGNNKLKHTRTELSIVSEIYKQSLTK